MGVNANEVTAAPAAVKKYHLVEAEEVDARSAAKSNSSNGAPGSTKKKGKTNWTQLPLETGGDDSNSSSEATDRSDDSSQRSGFRSGGGRGRGGNSNGGRSFGRGGGRGPRRNYDSNGSYINGVYVPNTDPKTTAQWAKEQIEFYFSPGNLVRDIFLRQHMDVDGFVPLAFVGSFQAVYSVHQDYASLLETMKDSELVELDLENEKVRLRDGWQKWLWPNSDGGYGVPRYIKAVVDGDDIEQPLA